MCEREREREREKEGMVIPKSESVAITSSGTFPPCATPVPRYVILPLPLENTFPILGRVRNVSWAVIFTRTVKTEETREQQSQKGKVELAARGSRRLPVSPQWLPWRRSTQCTSKYTVYFAERSFAHDRLIGHKT